MSEMLPKLAFGPRSKPYVWVGPDDRKLAETVLDEVAAAPSCALDTEFPPRGDRKHEAIIWSLSCGPGKRYALHGRWLREGPFIPWIADPKTKLVYFSFPADAPIIELNAKVSAEPSFWADVMVMGWLRNNMKAKYALKLEGRDYLDWNRQDYPHLFRYVPKGKKKPLVIMPDQLWDGPLPAEMLDVMDHEDWLELFKRYAADDADETHTLYRIHKQVLQRWNYWSTYVRLDRRYALTLRHGSDRGVPIDLEALQKIDLKISTDMLRYQTAIRSIVGKPEMNLNSRQQLAELFFEELGWPTYDDLMTKGTPNKPPEPQLNKVAFKRYAEDEGFHLARLMMSYNLLKTKKGGWCDGIRNGVQYGPGAKEDKLFSEYNQVGTKTGRMSSRKFTVEIDVVKTFKRKAPIVVQKKVKAGMNMLNFPNAFNDPFGIRSVVVGPWYSGPTCKCHRKGEHVRKRKKIVCGDFSGFELYMALYNCHKFGIKSEMLKALLDGKDVHSMTAVAVCGLKCDWSEVKKLHPDKRNNEGKRCNFNLLYGGGARMLCAILGWDTRLQRNLDKAQQMIDIWNDLWPEMPKLQRILVNHGYDHGWVPTIAGRKIWVADGLADSDEGIVRHYENICKNGPCQGSAADIVKEAQNQIDGDEELSQVYGYEQFFNVYDEIVGACYVEHEEDAVKRVTWHMQQSYKDDLPFLLPVEVHSGDNWRAAK